ncbi:MAG: cobyric acid synthase [Chloroflexi bacterium]|nr:cobyric acid synthase [Chloroflexota bacterium]
MVAGTASDVGKSVIATAEGWRVAPFKAQNMSLNAAVTPDGREIGRAQAAQAEACGIAPTAEMNPVLVKPEAEGRSQIVVLGRATRSVEARRFWRDRSALWPVVTTALRSLRRSYEVVVIEGAGSIAEVNLWPGDLANLRVARAADARILLVGDIERGGVFAQLLGTLDLLPARERARVRGLLVNRFRGDTSLFDAGMRFLRRASGIPVLGLLPHAEDLGVPAEDSLALERPPSAAAIDIAVVRYPRISNFDDLEPRAAAGAAVRYVRKAAALGVPDLLVLPGTKSTIDDLEWVRASGIGARIVALADAGVPIVGICGGLQMLGTALDDRAAVEGPSRRVRGFGLLPVRTRFAARKRTVPVTGSVAASSALIERSLAISGYELHMGRTDRDGCLPFAMLRHPDGRDVPDGAVSADGRIVGTYVHGLFETAPLRTSLLRALARRKGVAFAPQEAPADRYAALSAWFRAAVDVGRLLRAVDLERHG